MNAVELYNPSDVYAAHVLWGANCGPAALAAVLGRELSGVRELFPRFPDKPWCNPTQMKAAIDAAGVPWSVLNRQFNPRSPKPVLAFLQIEGPWCAPGVPIGAAYRHTHWVGLSGPMVYDVNFAEWLTSVDWATEIMPLILAGTKGATGWSVRTRIELDLSEGTT
ncbi:MAG TPA: hypothetical protein VGE74_19725 [Gemmata sp.]